MGPNSDGTSPSHQATCIDCKTQEPHLPLLPFFIPLQQRTVQGLKNWPIYDDVEARVQMLRQLGVEAPIVIRFTKRDLDYGAAELFTLLEQHSRIAELWLGPSQSLGRGESGSAETIARLASKKRINLVRRPSENGLNGVGFARDAMQAGRIEVAAKLVGHPPMWKRPKGGKLFLSWPAGTYEIVPLKEPTSSSQVACSGAMVKVQLKPNRRGRNTAVWPVLSAEWIAFTRGPGDL